MGYTGRIVVTAITILAMIIIDLVDLFYEQQKTSYVTNLPHYMNGSIQIL